MAKAKTAGATTRLRISLAAARKRADENRRQIDKLKQKIARMTSELAAARTRNPPPSAPPKAIAALGPPPADPLQAQEYTYQVLMLQLYDTMQDTRISSRERAQRLSALGAAAHDLMPRARLYQAEQIVLRNQAELALRVKERRGAKLESLPKPADVEEPHK